MKNIFFIMLLVLVSCGEKGTFIMNSDLCDGYSDPAQSKYILPYAVGTTFEIGQGNCGQVTHYGQGRFAYDFQMNDGTQILAVRSGIVEEVEESNPDSGGDAWSETNYVYIVHADGTMASYVHLQQNGVLVSKGDVVTQGDVIALSGNSGTQTPHLHFQVYKSKTKLLTIPITFRNAGENRHGLVEGKSYTALAFTPNND